MKKDAQMLEQSSYNEAVVMRVEYRGHEAIHLGFHHLTPLDYLDYHYRNHAQSG